MYSAMIGLSISFMVLGVILAITAVFVFFKKNMAQVYDALLDRGYQERLRHHKHTAAPAPATPSGPAVQPRQVQPSLMLSAVRRPLSRTLFTAFSMASASSAMPKE